MNAAARLSRLPPTQSSQAVPRWSDKSLYSCITPRTQPSLGCRTLQMCTSFLRKQQKGQRPPCRWKPWHHADFFLVLRAMAVSIKACHLPWVSSLTHSIGMVCGNSLIADLCAAKSLKDGSADLETEARGGKEVFSGLFASGN